MGFESTSFIRVGSIPGRTEVFYREQIEEGAKTLPLKRLGTPEEMAHGICFTLSEQAAYMTGSTLTMDGGVELPWWSKRTRGASKSGGESLTPQLLRIRGRFGHPWLLKPGWGLNVTTKNASDPLPVVAQRSRMGQLREGGRDKGSGTR